MAEERKQRYTEAERASQRANARGFEGGAKYGGSFASQGLKPQKEMGQSFLKREELKAKYGAFADPTWQYQERGGQLYRKALPNQTGRIAAGAGDWQPVPDFVQKAYENPQRRQFFEQHPDLAGQPGGGYDAWLYQNYLNRLKTDPSTGYKVNPQGDVYNPNVMDVYSSQARGGQVPGAVAGPGFDSQGAQPNYALPGGNMFGGGYGGFSGYVPGYSMPFGMASPGSFPGYAGMNVGSSTWGAYVPNQTYKPAVNTPSYRTLQQQGGSSFGSYPPTFQGTGAFGNYQPNWLPQSARIWT